jgi:hypothetical protein
MTNSIYALIRQILDTKFVSMKIPGQNLGKYTSIYILDAEPFPVHTELNILDIFDKQIEIVKVVV